MEFMMPQALIRFPDDTCVEYFYNSTHGVYADFTYPSTENLLSYGIDGYVVDEDNVFTSRGGYAPDEVLPFNDNYESWVLAVGLNYDCIFYGNTAEGIKTLPSAVLP